MHFTASVLAAAAVLALAANPAAASPAGIAGEVDVAVGLGPFHAEIDVAAGAELNLCHGRKHAGFSAGAKVSVECDFFSGEFRARMNTPAHLKYEEALEIYHDVQYIIRHTLMTRGMERLKRLIEVSALVKEGEDILVVADILNRNDGRKVRRSWIQHEINHLRAKFSDARWISMHLPNLCLAEDIYHFAIDASVAVVEFAVAVPIAVGAAVSIAVHEAAHLVARAFHYMGHVLKWAIDEIEYAFLMFRRKIKRGIKKVGHGLKKIGHEIKEGFAAIGAGIHAIGHEVKEGLEDGVSIIIDIGHHLRHHHKCHHTCSGNVGVVVGIDDSSSSSSSSSSSDQCNCEEDDGYAAITEVCVEAEEVCQKETFTAKVAAHYDIEVSWTKEESHTKVQECVTKVNAALGGLQTELKAIEAQVMRQDFD